MVLIIGGQPREHHDASRGRESRDARCGRSPMTRAMGTYCTGGTPVPVDAREPSPSPSLWEGIKTPITQSRDRWRGVTDLLRQAAQHLQLCSVSFINQTEVGVTSQARSSLRSLTKSLSSQ